MRLYTYERIDSTNVEAKRLWDQRRAEGQAEAFAVCAKQQTAGLGRSGRTWLSPPEGLWMSVVWPMRQDPARYEAAPLIVGLASADAIEAATGLACQIKWPNDLLVHGRKLAGILCQAEITGDGSTGNDAIIAGIGINGNFTIESLGDGLRHPPTTLQHELGHAVNLDTLCRQVCTSTQNRLEEFEQTGLAATLTGVRQKLAWLGHEVRLTDTDGGLRAAGTFTGLDERGHVLIVSGDTTHALAIGEMSLTFRMAEAGAK